MIGKKFTDLNSGKVIEVKDAFEDIAVLTDGSKVRVSRLLDRSFFDEYIDPKTFFNNQSLFENFAQKIRQIPDDVVRNFQDSNEFAPNIQNTNSATLDPFSPSSNESAVLPYDPEIEKEEIMKKYGIRKDPLAEARQQMDKINSLLNNMDDSQDDAPVRIDVVRDEVEAVQVPQNFSEQQPQSFAIPQNFQQQPNTTNVPPFDPVYQMFRGIKRNLDFNFSIPIHERIPRFDAIEMLEDSFEFSVIDFLATEFTNNLIENPEAIKSMIASEIRRLISEGGESQTKTKKRSQTKKTTTND